MNARIKEVTASQAKQNFGALLRAAAEGPVAIRRHKIAEAFVLSPRDFAARSGAAQTSTAESPGGLREGRRQSLLAQQSVERERLLKHHRIALMLLTEPARATALLKQARATVEKWQRLSLCSQDYIERWTAVLSMPRRQLALYIVSDMDGWGNALRQNSPWAGTLE